MKEQLVSFNTARLAKEKGFNGLSYYYIMEDNPKIIKESFNKNRAWDFNIEHQYIKPCKSITVPTQSLLQRWLREKHDIHIHVIATKLGFRVYVSAKGNRNLQAYKAFDTEFSYEEALEKGLQEALKLIKL